jgi:hypothetical protein
MNDTLSNMDKETKIRIFQSAKSELMRHSWDTFVDEPPSVAAGGNGVVIPGCSACRKRINTNDQYLSHLSDDVLPVILRKAFEIAGVIPQTDRSAGGRRGLD